MILHILIPIAGLMGAAGVVLAAAAAHAKPGMGLDAASQMLLVHAPAVIAACAVLARGLVSRPLTLIALTAMICGAALFAGDILARAYLGHRLFAFAAPTGGSLLIGAWVLLAVAALAAARKS
jgi:uncharacterized membrane protein YgdD (TMEM256/DUF423 family)